MKNEKNDIPGPIEFQEHSTLMQHDTRLEMRMIAAVMLCEKIPPEVTLTPDQFYDERHQFLWKQFAELHAAGIPLRITTLCDRVKNPDKIKNLINYILDCLSKLSFHCATLPDEDYGALDYKKLNDDIRNIYLRRRKKVALDVTVNHLFHGDVMAAMAALDGFVEEVRGYAD